MSTEVSEASGDDDELLRRHGLQVTAQRLAVLRAVSDGPHSTADDIDDVVLSPLGLFHFEPGPLAWRPAPAAAAAR